VTVGAAGDQRHGIALLAEPMCDGHAQAGAGTEDDKDRTSRS
jgi:hypothetical protein